MSKAKSAILSAGLLLGLALVGSMQPAMATAPSIYWHWHKMNAKPKDCGRKAYTVLRTYVGHPTKKGDNTVWARNAEVSTTIQCIDMGKKKSLAVIIVSSNNAYRAKRLRNYMRCEMASSKSVANSACGEG